MVHNCHFPFSVFAEQQHIKRWDKVRFDFYPKGKVSVMDDAPFLYFIQNVLCMQKYLNLAIMWAASANLVYAR